MGADRRKKADSSIDSVFLDRWSPVSFAETKLEPAQIASLFEAARWAPSSYNEQPWFFVYADSDEHLPKFRQLLVEKNREWADKAPLLIFVFAKKFLSRGGKPNGCAEFDTGAAVMSLALQAVKMGLHTHAMAGIVHDKIYTELNVPEAEFQGICAIAVGYYDHEAVLPPDLANREIPSSRITREEFAHRGGFVPKK